MTSRFAISTDSTRIAYDVAGSGPPVVLLHGGGQSRRVWHDADYVRRVQGEFTVITMDLRGHGDSDTPTDAAAYALERVTDDVLAVADAAGATRFAVWGYSYGGNIARYLPARSNRVSRLAIIGIPFGAAAAPAFRALILGLCAKWAPIVDADRAGVLDVSALSSEDRAAWETGTPIGPISVALAWLSAMLDWPSLEPADVQCPALWLVGTANENAMPSVNEYSPVLAHTNVTLYLAPELTHERELTSVNEVLPALLEFTRAE